MLNFDAAAQVMKTLMRLAGAVAETATADPKTALKSPLAARTQIKLLL